MAERKRLKRTTGLVLTLLLLTALVSAAEPEYALDWWTVDGGGGSSSSSGGNYALSGTLGQADAGPEMSGGEFGLVGGFWEGGGEVVVYDEVVYLPLVQRDAQ